jgi:hypothetical protein
LPDHPALLPEANSRAIPKITVVELDTDPHGMFRRYREEVPFLERADGVKRRGIVTPFLG